MMNDVASPVQNATCRIDLARARNGTMLPNVESISPTHQENDVNDIRDIFGIIDRRIKPPIYYRRLRATCANSSVLQRTEVAISS